MREILLCHRCDGVIEKFIPELVEVGVGIFDPVQPECNDLAVIKIEYGDKLTIQGTVSVQEALRMDRLEIKAYVGEKVRPSAPGGVAP